jgi:hypothetical protein
MGKLVFGVGIFASLIIIGAIIHNVAQSVLLKDMHDRPGEYYPNTAGNSPASQKTEPYSNAVTSFYIMSEFDDTGNKRRDWSRSGDTWIERQPNGQTNEFRLVGRSSMGNCPGVIAQKVDSVSQVFIPDKGCNDMPLRYRRDLLHKSGRRIDQPERLDFLSHPIAIWHAQKSHPI